jgi:D-sedoheptulose 7-phosphate isomerase
MMGPQEFYNRYKDQLVGYLDALDREAFAAVVDLIWRTYQGGKTIFVFGNGGSAATASHFASDLSKGPLGHKGDRLVDRFRVIALTDNVSIITAWANDTGYENVFSEPLKNLAKKGDLAIAISASGNSPNVLKAVEVAKAIGVKTIGFCGFDGGKLAKIADVALVVETERGEYEVVEDVHDTLHHMITQYFTERLAGEVEK